MFYYYRWQVRQQEILLAVHLVTLAVHPFLLNRHPQAKDKAL